MLGAFCDCKFPNVSYYGKYVKVIKFKNLQKQSQPNNKNLNVVIKQNLYCFSEYEECQRRRKERDTTNKALNSLLLLMRVTKQESRKDFIKWDKPMATLKVSQLNKQENRTKELYYQYISNNPHTEGKEEN